MLAEIVASRNGVPVSKTLVVENGSPIDPGVLSRLIMQASPAAGKVSIALPLQFFEIVNLTLPMLPEEAVGKTLPYHLAKIVDKPLSDYIFDWQIIKRLKDKLQVVVYLFPAKNYTAMQQEFKKNQLEAAFFEPDVFAAFAYLNRNGQLTDNESVMCVIVWPDSLSLAVCEAGRLKLTRTVDLLQPKNDLVDDSSYKEDGQRSEGNGVAPEDDYPAEPEGGFVDDTQDIDSSGSVGCEHNENSILAGFDIFLSGSDQPQSDSGNELFMADKDSSNLVQENKRPEPACISWDEYLGMINIEIMRTRDYYSSVIKGGNIRSYYVLGAEDFFDQLRILVMQSTGEELKKFLDKPADDAPCGLTLHVVGLGAGTRG